MAKRYTVGIIGLGFGRAHIPAFLASGCEVVAVCQGNLETAKSVAARSRLTSGAIDDGARAQEVLDAVLASVARGGWVTCDGAA